MTPSQPTQTAVTPPAGIVERAVLSSTDDDQLTLTFTEPAKYRTFPGTGRCTVEDSTLTLSALQTGTIALWCTLTRR